MPHGPGQGSRLRRIDISHPERYSSGTAIFNLAFFDGRDR
jgi:hypothetical protein